MKNAILSIVVVIVSSTVVLAQEPMNQTEDEFSVHGFLNMFSELYGISGDNAIARRPASTFRSAGMIEVGYEGLFIRLNALYSTEQNPLLQSLNQVGISARYGGLEVEYGALFPQYARQLLNGQQVTGVEASFIGGGIIVGGVSGTNTSARNGDSITGVFSTFERNITALKIGIGKPEASYLMLGALKATDNENSVTELYGSLPEENIVAGLSGSMNIAENTLVLQFEANASAFNRDKRADKIEVDGIPSFLTEIFRPTLSSSLGYAITGEARYNASVWGITSNVNLLSAGYRSLGVASFVNDQLEWSIRPMVRLLQSRLIIQAGLSQAENNRNNARIATIRRTTANASITVIPSNAMTLTSIFLYSRNSSETSLAGAEDVIRNTNIVNITLTPTFIYSLGEASAITSLTATYTSIGNTSSGADSAAAGGLTENINLGLQQTYSLQELSATLSLGGSFASNITTYYGTIGGTYRLSPELQSNITIQANRSTGTLFTSDMISGVLALAYSPWQHHTITVSGRGSAVSTGLLTFLETSGNLTYAVTF